MAVLNKNYKGGKKTMKKDKKDKKDKKGGLGALGSSEYVQAVAGNMGQQVQMPSVGGNENNALQFNAQSAMSMRGGKNKRKGGTFGEIALPAVLLIANEAVKKRMNKTSKMSSNSFNKSRKFRK
jgi:hypothetical protein